MNKINITEYDHKKNNNAIWKNDVNINDVKNVNVFHTDLIKYGNQPLHKIGNNENVLQKNNGYKNNLNKNNVIGEYQNYKNQIHQSNGIVNEYSINAERINQMNYFRDNSNNLQTNRTQRQFINNGNYNKFDTVIEIPREQTLSNWQFDKIQFPVRSNSGVSESVLMKKMNNLDVNKLSSDIIYNNIQIPSLSKERYYQNHSQFGGLNKVNNFGYNFMHNEENKMPVMNMNYTQNMSDNVNNKIRHVSNVHINKMIVPYIYNSYNPMFLPFNSMNMKNNESLFNINYSQNYLQTLPVNTMNHNTHYYMKNKFLSHINLPKFRSFHSNKNYSQQINSNKINIKKMLLNTEFDTVSIPEPIGEIFSNIILNKKSIHENIITYAKLLSEIIGVDLIKVNDTVVFSKLPNDDDLDKYFPFFNLMSEETKHVIRRCLVNVNYQKCLTYIIYQVDFYMLDTSLLNDKYLRTKMSYDGFINITILLEFNEIKELTGNRLDNLQASMVFSDTSIMDGSCKYIRKKVKPEMWPLKI